MKLFNVYFYADDAQLSCTFDPSDLNKDLRHMNDDLQIITNKTLEHCENLNASKSMAMLFAS